MPKPVINKPVAFDFSLEPKQALDYLNNKGYLLSFDYDELAPALHHKSFTVAKVTRLDLLHDIFNSLDTAYKNGMPFDEWKANIEPTLAKKGWLGKTEITNPKTGEVKAINVNARRLRTIYDTNKRVAYAEQRHASQRGLVNSVYWRYRSMLLPNSRENHKAMHGTTLHRDDPFWQTNYPPNGWGCKCTVQAFSQKQLERRGITVNSKAPDSIVEKDWTAIGQGFSIARLSKMELDSSLPTFLADKSMDDLTEIELKQRFFDNLGIKEGDLFIDKVGDPMWLDDALFMDKKAKKLKIKKRERHYYIDILPSVLTDPDEIYLETEANGSLIKKMFKYFTHEDGSQKGLIGIFRYNKDKTQGASLYYIEETKMTEKKRTSKLIYKKAVAE